MAGVIPGILLAILFAITIVIWAKISPEIAPAAPKISWRERLTGLVDLGNFGVICNSHRGYLHGGFHAYRGCRRGYFLYLRPRLG